MNPAERHLDFFWCESADVGRLPVKSSFTVGSMIGISVHDTTNGTTIADLGMTDVRVPAPVFHGDTMRVATEVMDKRESSSRPEAAIAELEHRAFDRIGALVASCRGQAFMMTTPAA